jgi:ATP-binding cassette subfamily F protein uup
LLAQPHDGAQRLDVEAVALGLGVDVADVVGDGLFFFFQPLDALDDRLELILRNRVVTERTP